MAYIIESKDVLKMDDDQIGVVPENNATDGSVHHTNEHHGVFQAESTRDSIVEVSQLADNPLILADEHQGVFEAYRKQANVVEAGLVGDDSVIPVQQEHAKQQSLHASESAAELNAPREPTFKASLFYGSNWETVEGEPESESGGDDVDSVISEDLGGAQIEKVEKDEELDFAGRRKVKKARPMNKQEQDDYMARIKAQLNAFPPVPVPGFLDCYLADGGSYENCATEASESPPKRAKKTPSPAKPAKPISSETSTPQSSKRKTPERGRGHKRKGKRQKTEQQEKERKVEEGMALIRTLQKQEAMKAVFTYAGECLDKQDDSGSLIKELVQMELCWQDADRVHCDNLMEFLKRHGVVPMGGIDD